METQEAAGESSKRLQEHRQMELKRNNFQNVVFCEHFAVCGATVRICGSRMIDDCNNNLVRVCVDLGSTSELKPKERLLLLK